MAKKRDVYRSAKDKKVPSVTQITGMLAKPALVPWAAKCVVEYIKANAEPAHGGYWTNDQFLDEAKNAHRMKLEDAGNFGSNIHSLVGAYVERQLVPGEVDDEKEKKALENFRTVTEGWTWLGSEVVVVHEKLKYGGTTDAIARLPDGTIVVVDFKTSKGVYPEHGLQIAMYAFAEPVDPALKETWTQITEGRIIHFDKERLTWEVLERDVKSHYKFIPHFRKVYEWTQNS